MKKYKKFIIYALFLSLFNIGIIFANNNLKFTHLTVENGLSQSIVWKVIQDKDGYIWIGTDNGLSKYDGRRFKVYVSSKEDNHLSGNKIRALINRSDNTLLIGSDGGIDIYDPIIDGFKKLEIDGLEKYSVTSLLEDSNQNLWIGTRRGLYKLEKDGVLRVYDKESDIGTDIIWSLLEDENGRIWAASENKGVYKINPDTMEFSNYNKSNSDINSNRITSMVEDRDGIWVGSDGDGLGKISYNGELKRLYKYDANNSKSISDDSIKSIYIDSFGELWIGTRNGGLNRYNQDKDSFVSYKNSIYDIESINSNNIRDIYEDSSGVIWIGTFNGIDKYIRNRDNFNHFKQDVFSKNSLNSNFIRVIIESKDKKLWIGTDGGGLNSFNPENELFKNYTHDENNQNSISENIVISLGEDSRGNIWVGTDGKGINRLNSKTDQIERFNKENAKISSDYVDYIYVDSKDTIWLKKGFKKVEDNKFNEYLEDANPNVIYEDSRSQIWIGTNNKGVYRYTYNDFMFRYYPIEKGIIDFIEFKGKGIYGISQNKIILLKDGSDSFLSLASYDQNMKRIIGIIDNKIWIRTENKIIVFDTDKIEFEDDSENTRFENTSIKSALIDQEQNIWMGTTTGLFKKITKENKMVQYKKEDGLQGNEFNQSSLLSKEGYLYFGGNNGFNMIYPKKIRQNQNIPKIVLTSIKKFDQEIHPQSSIVNLKSNENFFSIEFAALEYTNPSENQYAYKLEGIDKEWVYSGTRNYALYTNISPGGYRFKVKGSNNEGIWSDEQELIRIKIQTPFLKSPFAYCLYLIIIIFTINQVLNEIKRREKLKTERLIFKEIEDKNKELEEINKELKEISSLDSLTKIPNRREFDRIMELKFRESKLNNNALGIMMIDIDFFKNYNDTYGHLKGDLCIESIAKILAENLRGTDFVARYGGEEFVVIVDNLEDDNIILLAEKLRAAVESQNIPHSNGVLDRVTISIGIKNTHKIEDIGISNIIEKADNALYQAKKAGRNIAMLNIE